MDKYRPLIGNDLLVLMILKSDMKQKDLFIAVVLKETQIYVIKKQYFQTKETV